MDITQHSLHTKKFDEEMNNPMRSELEKQLATKRQIVSSSEIFDFFTTKVPYKKEYVQHKENLEDLALLIVKNHLPMHFVESPWL